MITIVNFVNYSKLKYSLSKSFKNDEHLYSNNTLLIIFIR